MAHPFQKKKTNFNALIDNNQEGIWWKKAWQQGKKALAKSPKETQSRRLLFEVLEPRILMSADLSYGTATDLTLAYHAGNGSDDPAQFRLLDESDNIISSANAIDALDGGISITGTSGDDILKLDMASLSALNAAVNLTFLGEGADTLSVENDANFELSDSELQVGSVTFSLVDATDAISFESAELMGGNSANVFTLIGWSGDLTIDGGAGNDTLQGPDDDFDWQVTAANEGYVSGGGFFSSIENLEGGSGSDAFKIDLGGALDGLIDGGSGDNALVADNGDNEWIVIATDEGTLNGLSFKNIKNLIGGTGNDTFDFDDEATISGYLDGGAEDGDDTETEVNSISFAAYTDQITVALPDSAIQDQQGRVTSGSITVVGAFASIDSFEGGSSDDDEVIGPTEKSVVWTISGEDEFSVAEISFSDFQNLSGANNNTDVFVIEGLGNITGTIDGGTGGSDGLIFIDPTDEETYKAYNPSSLINNQSGTTSGGDAFSKAIDYAGMDYVNFFNKTDPLNPIISGSIFNDTITVTEDPDVAGGIKISYAGNIYKLSQQEVTSLVSLRIDGMEGKDTIIVEPLPTNFTGSLYLYGHRLQRADLLYPDMPEDDVYQDTVIFRDKRTTVQRDSGVPNDLPLASLTPYYLEVFTDHVQVEDGVRIQAGDDGIFFRNRDIGVATFENLSPILPTTRNVSVDIGKNAILEGGSIYFVLQAEDKSFSDIIGASNEVSKFVIEPLTGLLEGAVSMPVKILVKKSEAKITVKEGAQLLSAGTLGMYATAVSDSSGAASSSLISIGYAQAKAYADIQIQKDVVITAADAVVITSTANSTANISASTTREVSSTPNPGSKQIALAIGVANADVVSYVTVAEGAAITAGKTANVTAGGDINAEASAEAGMYAEGAAGLAFGIEISNADIHTIVNGSITALMEPGAVVKLEIDPTVKGFDYKSTQTINRLENGKVVKLMNDFNDDLPKGTLLTYIGNTRNGSIDLTPEGTGAGFSTTGENYADDSIWEIKTPDFGYVDYDFDRVYLGDTALVTEDTITYANRRGTSIGNMVDGREYYVIQDDVDGYYKFAETETQAIRASLGYESGNIVNLIDESGTAIETNNNERSFDGADVDASTDSISLPWGGGVFNTFELGQAVVYHEGSAPIAGLVDGNTYYVAASTNQTNLQGNTRFTDKQVIGLSESENESRGGVLIDIGPTTGNGYKLAAKHVLDSDFATGIGVVAKLGAENNASASAGLTEEDANPGYWSKFTSAVETNLPDTLLGKLTKKYSEAQKANAGASNELSVAGALAFSFVEHSVLTDVGSSAVLKSNEDLEVKALISQKYTLGAESNVEPSLNSADTVASVAINIGIFNNTAIATIHSKLDSSGNVTQAAELDGLRATRIISDVTYPFLTRFDQYIPLSWGEFVDGIRTDGLDAITKYFNSTLGLKDSFFNTWVAATAEAEKLSIAGSVNVMILDNVSQAVVEAGVKINQDDTWHVTGADNDHPNQADNQSDGKGEEVVSIEATNYQQVINMTGIFALPGLELDIIPNPSADPKASKLKLKKELSKNVLGTGGGSKGGAGGSIFVNVQNNTTHAIVEDEAQIYSGADGGFNMKAEEALFNIHLAQSAGKGGGFAVAGSVVYAGQDSDTLVQVGDTAEITGRDMRLYAGDLTTTASWAGGVAVGDGVGVGFSLAINDFDRKTRAVVGNPDVLTAVAGAPGSSSYINVTDKVDVLAKVDGDLWSFSVAGAVASGDTGGTPPPQDSPLKAQKLLGTDVEPPASGFGAAAALSVNIVKDNTQASIVNAGKLKAGSVTVTATDDFFQVAVTGGASFAKGQAGSTSGSTSLAGAFSFNELDVKTRAFILDTDIVTAGDIIVDAKRTGDLITLSAGGSIATGQGGKAIAGSVSINLIFNVTEAYLSGVDAEVDGDVSVTASDNSRIIAVGGGLAFALGGKIGVGLGVGANILGSDVKPTITRAYISDSTLVIGGDSLTVTATNDNVDSDGRIFAITAGVGVAGGPDATVGLGAMLSVNLITNTTEAYVRNTKIDEELDENGDPIDPKLNTRVEARDDSGIIAIGGAVGVSTGNAIGAAIGYNEIDNDVKAYLEDVDLTADGTLTVKATSDAEIGGVALGVAVAAGPSGKIAGAGSLLINQITNTIDAHIIDSDVTVGGDVLIQASDNSLIVSISGGIAVGIGSKAAIGAAISYNLIQNRNLAYIESSTVHSTTGAVTLSAADEALLVALAVGGAGAQDFALGGSVMVNSIANTVDAHISKNSDVFARTDLSVTARESSSLVAIGGGIGVAVKGSAVGAAIAYNYVGGSFDDANPNLISRDSTATNKISAYIDDSKAVADGNITVAGGFTPPVDATAGHSSITAKVAAFNPNAANAVDLTSNTLTFATAHGYEDGQAVTYRNGGGDSIEGLTDGEVYYVKRIDDNSLKLQTKNLEVQSFDPSDDDVIDLNANTITFAEDHGYQDGDVVVYYNGSETDDTDSLGGLNNVTQYVVQVIDAKTIKLQTQNSGGQLEVVNLTSIGDGTYHSLHHEKLEVVDLETKGSGASHSLRVTQIGIGDTQIALPVELSSGITSITLGGAGAANFALGGSVSISFIKNSIDARISNVSATENQEVKAGGTLSVSADDSSKIFALAGGVAISVSGPQQSGPGVAVGVAVAANIIDNAILATVVDASLVADGDIEVSAKSEASINAITLAGAVAAALKSDSAVAVAGGGSIAVNEVGNTVEASITGSDSVESTAGDIRVTADDIASIDAVAIAATVSAAFGLSSGGSVAIGFSLGFNTIDNSVDAFVKNVDSVKTKTAGKGVTVEANAEGRHRFNLTDSSQFNDLITGLDDAAVKDSDDPDTVPDPDHPEIPTDEAEIDAKADAAFLTTLKATFKTNGVSLNGKAEDLKISTLKAGSEWLVFDGRSTYRIAKVLDSNGNPVRFEVRGGNIQAVSVAASVALAGSLGGLGLAISGAGAGAANNILTDTRAYIDGSSVDSAGDVRVASANNAVINATVVAISVAASVGDVGAAASLGIAVARNQIGYEADTSETYDYDLDDANVAYLEKGDKVRINKGVLSGDVYEYVPDTSYTYTNTLTTTQSSWPTEVNPGDTVKVGNKVYRLKFDEDGLSNSSGVNLGTQDYTSANSVWEEIKVDFRGQDYSNTGLWKRVGSDKAPNDVAAYITNSSITQADDVTVIALSGQSINAGVGAGSAAVTGGSNAAVGISGAGVGNENKVA
ncbi:MAG: LEPR-XLL domain-containing protein, partial [Methylomicrobium sp.]|nr:LEPR-XLL domain-containing protein [Methylomicrobium sp.]